MTIHVIAYKLISPEKEQRNWVFVTNYDFLISISLQPNAVDLSTSNYEFCWMKKSKFEIRKVYTIRWKKYRNLEKVCYNDLIPLQLKRL